MKTVRECDLNWLQDCDGLGMVAQVRQAEIRQDRRAVSLQYASRASGTPQFTRQRALAFASTIADTVGMMALRWLG